MCRFLVYKGRDEILLSKLILDPPHSVMKQSFDCRLLRHSRGANNADGFGIGFYTDPSLGQAPCLFTSTLPAWNCANLKRIATKTASRLVFAHLRATLDEGIISEDNCHPFSYGSLMWMHNGQIGRWRLVKRSLAQRLADRWYNFVRGTTDSEWGFALFLDTLDKMGFDPSSEPVGGFNPAVLRSALVRTIGIINDLTDAVEEDDVVAQTRGSRSLLNFALSDGHTVLCTRYVNSSTIEPASLFYSSGSEWRARPSAVDDRQFEMDRHDKGADIVLVASEPLTFERENWVHLPANSMLTIHKQTVMVHPIMDQYYTDHPSQSRSKDFVQTKGITALDFAQAMSSVGTIYVAPPASAFVPTPATSVLKSGMPIKALMPAVTPSVVGAEAIAGSNGGNGGNGVATEPHPGHIVSMASSRIPRRPGSLTDQQAAAASLLAQSLIPSLSLSAASRQPATSTHVSTTQFASPSRSLGNISRKRASLHLPERTRLGIPPFPFAGIDPDDDTDNLLEPPSPLEHPFPRTTEFGNSTKLARFFPELTLS